MLMQASGDPVAKAGDTFVVHMDREALNGYPLGLYDVTVEIITFEPDQEIAWTVCRSRQASPRLLGPATAAAGGVCPDAGASRHPASRVSAMPVAHSLLWAQSRKSPSAARMAEATARSGKLRCFLASFPVKIW